MAAIVHDLALENYGFGGDHPFDPLRVRLALELCEALGLGPRLISTTPPRTAYVLKNGRLHALPSPSILGIPTTWRGLAAYDLLPPAARLRLAIEPIIPRRRGGGPPPRDDESIGAFFRRRFGPAAVDLIAEPLLGGIHAGDIDALYEQGQAQQAG